MGVKVRGKFNRNRDGVVISGHCDGLICLTDGRGKNIVLCNPAIKEFKLLPESDIVLSSPEKRYPTLAVGIGCDLKSNDYKVVRIVSYGEEEYDADDPRYYYRVVQNPPKAEVYSLNTNAWTEVKADNIVTETSIFWPDSGSIYSNGTCYWFARERKKDYLFAFTPPDDEEEEEGVLTTPVIIAYDMADEVFRIIPYPYPDGADFYYPRRTFAVWNESIALCDPTWDLEARSSFGLWVLDDIAGVESSWTKYLTIDPVVQIQHPLAFHKDKFLLIATTESVVVFYNVCTHKFKYLPLNGVFLDRSQALVYVISIVSVKGSNMLVCF